MPLSAGEAAPLFTLSNQQGQPISLSELLQDSVVVLYFYPKDFTPGCTKEACSFRDSYEVFRDAGAEVVGVSRDSGERHRKFAEKYRLPFQLLTDDGSVAKRYEVGKTLGLLPGRVTFVIDRQGTIRHSFSSQLLLGKHVDDALKIVRSLS